MRGKRGWVRIRDGNLTHGFGYPLDIRPDGSGYRYVFLTRGLNPYPIRGKVGMDLDIKPHPRVTRWISEINQYFNCFPDR